MYYLDKRPQYSVRAETPDPFFARQPQQAIVSIEGESRVCTQYAFQAWDARGPSAPTRRRARGAAAPRALVTTVLRRSAPAARLPQLAHQEQDPRADQD